MISSHSNDVSVRGFGLPEIFKRLLVMHTCHAYVVDRKSTLTDISVITDPKKLRLPVKDFGPKSIGYRLKLTG